MDLHQRLLKELNVNRRLEVTVWDLANDDLEYSFESTILDKDGQFLLVAAPGKPRQEIIRNMQAGVTLGVVVDSNPNPLIFYPVVHLLCDSPQGYWIKLPEGMPVEASAPRHHVRIPMLLPIEVHFMSAKGARIVKGLTEDLSGGGVRFDCVQLFEPNQEVTINLQFSDSPAAGEAPEADMLLRAKVIFSKENDRAKDPAMAYTTGCQFIGITEPQEKIIMRECFRRELRYGQQ